MKKPPKRPAAQTAGGNQSTASQVAAAPVRSVGNSSDTIVELDTVPKAHPLPVLTIITPILNVKNDHILKTLHKRVAVTKGSCLLHEPFVTAPSAHHLISNNDRAAAEYYDIPGHRQQHASKCF